MIRILEGLQAKTQLGLMGDLTFISMRLILPNGLIRGGGHEELGAENFNEKLLATPLGRGPEKLLLIHMVGRKGQPHLRTRLQMQQRHNGKNGKISVVDTIHNKETKTVHMHIRTLSIQTTISTKDRNHQMTHYQVMVGS
jgi:hypothetical protein